MFVDNTMSYLTCVLNASGNIYCTFIGVEDDLGIQLSWLSSSFLTVSGFFVVAGTTGLRPVLPLAYVRYYRGSTTLVIPGTDVGAGGAQHYRARPVVLCIRYYRMPSGTTACIHAVLPWV